MRRFGRILLSSLVCAAAGACASGRVAPGTLAQDERDVLLAVLRYEQADSGNLQPVFGPLDVADFEEEFVEDTEATLEERELQFPLEVFDDVVRRSRRRVPLRQLAGEGAGVRWITEAQLDSVYSARSDSARLGVLQRMHPGSQAIVQLSRAGFDATRTHASVAYGEWCGDLCGTAGVYLLERRSGEWRVIQRMATILF